jgi:uncharacterized damage-inducible protein DinB
MTSDVRYPLGQPELLPALDRETRRWKIRTLESAPGKLRRLVEPLDSRQLDQPLRAGAWTLRQLIHHLADSQLHGYMRFRWALTESPAQIKTYDQDAWATLPDIAHGPVGLSLRLLEALHARWVFLLVKMQDADFARETYHPELGTLTLDQLLALYAWHFEHHIAQLRAKVVSEGEIH